MLQSTETEKYGVIVTIFSFIGSAAFFLYILLKLHYLNKLWNVRENGSGCHRIIKLICKNRIKNIRYIKKWSFDHD